MNISPGESLRTSFTAVWSNRLRSLLTILGIVIRITTTVVTVSSLLTGVRGSIVAFFQQLGPDNIFVFKSTFGPDPPEGSPRANQRHRRPLRPEFAEAIRRWCPGSVADVGIELMIPTTSSGKTMSLKVAGYESDSFNVMAAPANLNDLSPRNLRVGRFFTPDEDGRGARVAVLGSGLSDALFPDGRAPLRPVMRAE